MGDNPSVKDDQVQPGYAPYVPPTDFGAKTTVPAEDLTVSTIGPSQQAPPNQTPGAESPALTIPKTTELTEDDLSIITPAQIALQFTETLHNIINDMLDSWHKSLDEQDKLIQEKLQSPAYLVWQEQHSGAYLATEQAKNRVETEKQVVSSPEYATWVASLAPTAKTEQMDYKNTVLSQADGVNMVSMTKACFGITSPAMIENTQPLGAAATGLTIPMVGTGKALPLAIPGDENIGLGLFSALFAISVTSQQKATPAGVVDPNLKQAAKSFVGNLLSWMKDGKMDSLIKNSVIPNVRGSDALSDQRKDQLASIVKIVMLSAALALSYKGDTGWITDLEFGAMVQTPGKMGITDNDPKGQLVAYIIENKNNLPRAEASHLFNALLAYVNTNPDVEGLTNPDSLFRNLLTHYLDRGPLQG